MDPAPVTPSVGFKAEGDMDCGVYTEPAIDWLASHEAGNAGLSSGSQAWAGMGVDLSGGDDPFHADWAFWK